MLFLNILRIYIKYIIIKYIYVFNTIKLEKPLHTSILLSVKCDGLDISCVNPIHIILQSKMMNLHKY